VLQPLHARGDSPKYPLDNKEGGNYIRSVCDDEKNPWH
jgi:hypothetical protein